MLSLGMDVLDESLPAWIAASCSVDAMRIPAALTQVLLWHMVFFAESGASEALLVIFRAVNTRYRVLSPRLWETRDNARGASHLRLLVPYFLEEYVPMLVGVKKRYPALSQRWWCRRKGWRTRE
jgi:hypothetical protein